jgi:hypothetical protein
MGRIEYCLAVNTAPLQPNAGKSLAWKMQSTNPYHARPYR